ncbi:arsenical pump-driving ATPase [Thermococcus cleftensis]|uniref:Arsenical pump-driving ATPase n=1 Tax=Thermococcus cleftensis (strain DSM 27260 / KACC 17922 / CL1) TaxID=163003 RepID=I3ZWB4_THECF|nr:ArsA family ATPase [Thermococcus cleftensis]AFL95998.1 arsenical pump-driving ATPase [Thermococcus cleftensis]
MREFFLPKKGYRVVFFIGKGGVGKTTSSAAAATALAERGYRTLVVSLDPAHNLGDVLMVKLKDKPKKIAENLYAAELDMEKLIKTYLKHLEESMKHTYRYLTVINLEKYFEVLSYSPGIEEYATLEAVREILVKGDEWDVIIFDTPPTGLTLRVLALPRISLIWADKLIEIRKAILERRAAIANIHGEQEFVVGDERVKLPTKEEEDAVMRELKKYREEVAFVEGVITNPRKTSVVAVMNPEMLPLYETERARESLRKFHVPFNMIVMNKVLELKGEIPELRAKLETQEMVLREVGRKFPGVEMVKIPVFAEEPRGLERLRELGGIIVEG